MHGMHLWYLAFLFVYSLICYRLFVWFKASGSGILERITGFSAIPGFMVPLFVIPLLIMKVLIPHSIVDVGNGGWGFLYYLWFLIAGFIISSSDQLQNSIKKQRWVTLFLGLILSVTYLYLLFGVSSPVFQGRNGNWGSTLLSFFSAWSWVFAILGFGLQHLSFDHPLLRPANEGVLAFFIMHQTVLVGFGYYIMNWEIHDVLKWTLVFTISFVFIVALYSMIIRKFDLLRFLFGMKTSNPFFTLFRKKSVLIALLASWIGITVFAGFNQKAVSDQNRPSMPLTYNPGLDIVLDANSLTNSSPTGVRVVDDEKASIGKSIEFIEGGKNRIEAQPEVYIESHFSAPAGSYYLWLRGKSEIEGELSDSVWLQADNQIGTQRGSVHLGNWNSFHPIGIYAWGSNVHIPIIIRLKHTGKHIIRIQPRQTPHRIDQIWLSRSQKKIPNSNQPVK
jgi:acyltransferase-like protein